LQYWNNDELLISIISYPRKVIFQIKTEEKLYSKFNFSRKINWYKYTGTFNIEKSRTNELDLEKLIKDHEYKYKEIFLK